MIQIVAKIINLLGITVHSAFAIASFIGKIIVTLFTNIIQFVYGVIQGFFLFFEIIYEDNSYIFTEEIPNAALYVLSVCKQQTDQIVTLVTNVFTDIYLQLESTITTAAWSAKAACTIVTQVFVLGKKTVIFIGDTIWLIITFIPIQLPLLLKGVMKYAKDVFVKAVIDAYSMLLKLTNFLTDVPLESFIGIISAIVIVRLCIHYNHSIQRHATSIYWSLMRKILYWYHVLYNYFADSEVRAIARLASGQEVNELPDAVADLLEEEDVGDSTDALCVVCQERQKCVLILPCRHVCLCRECCLRLYGYQRSCPICRTFIYHSVTIYI